MLMSEFDVNFPITDTQMSALTYACSLSDITPQQKQNNTQMVGNIMTCGPNLNHQDQFGRSPLHMACMAGNESAVGLLLQTN